MADLLISDVPDDELRRVDEKAARLGLTRIDYVRRLIAQDAARPVPGARVDGGAFERFGVLTQDLRNGDLMRDAWS